MKAIKALLFLMIGALCSAFFGFSVADAAGLDAQMGAGVGVGLSVIAGFLPMPQGVVSAQLYNELIVKVITENLNFVATWVERIMSRQEWVTNNSIKIPKEGADVDGYINTSFPLTAAARVDDFDTIAMDRFDTQPRTLDRKELMIPYDVEGSEIRFHRRTLEKMSRKYGLHGLAPASHAATTPVLETTGADDGTGRKRLTRKDLIDFQAALDALEYEKEGRVLVLCGKHKADLLLEDTTFGQTLQFHNANRGEVSELYYGFILETDVYNPMYANVAKTKLAYGATPAGNDRNASTFFYLPQVAKARGDVGVSISRKENEPLTKQTTMSTDMYHKITGYGKHYSAAMIDGRV